MMHLIWHKQQLVDITSHRLIYAMTNLIILKIVSKIYILGTILSTNISQFIELTTDPKLLYTTKQNSFNFYKNKTKKIEVEIDI